MRLSSLAPVFLLTWTAFGQAPDAVIRSSVREVLLDVVVRDAHGRLVNNLKPGEVTVYEDGVRQEVRSFRLVAGSEVRIEDQKQAAEALGSGAKLAGSSIARPPVNPLRTVNVVCLILNDLNPETRAFAFESARKFVNEELRPNTFIGVFSLDGSGLRPVFPFSNNREHLLKAVELAAVNQLPSVNLGSAALLSGLSMSVTGSVTPGTSATGNADGSSPADPLGTRGDMGFSVNAGLREIDALKGLVRQLSPLPFQKTVLLLSTGLTRPPDQLEYWDSLIHAATKSGVTFYAMDVWGLGVCQDVSSDSCTAPQSAIAPAAAMLEYTAALSRGQATAGTNNLPSTPTGPPQSSSTAQLMEMAHQDDYLKFGVSSANRQEAIRELAERTGGFLIANTNNTDKLLTHVMEEVDTHYEIAYPPTSEREDGHFRKVDVRLARPGLHVETRSGYFAIPDTGEGPVTPAEMAGLRALDTQPRPHTFDFLSRAYRFRDAGGTAQYAIAFEMPISNLTATPAAAAHKHRLHASMLALVKNAQGQIVDRVSKDVPSEVPDDRLAAVQVELMTYQHAVNLPPGHYTVETAVVDYEGNRASTGVVQIDNREQRGVGLSDLTLVRRLDRLGPPPDPADPFEYTGKRVLPFVTTDLFAGALPFVYMVIYPEPGNPSNPELRVRLLTNGRLLTTINPALPSPDISGGIPMVIQPTSKPGSYEIRATVAQGGNSVERSLAYTVAGR
jgi:VWFA-related protein